MPLNPSSLPKKAVRNVDEIIQLLNSGTAKSKRRHFRLTDSYTCERDRHIQSGQTKLLGLLEELSSFPFALLLSSSYHVELLLVFLESLNEIKASLKRRFHFKVSAYNPELLSNLFVRLNYIILELKQFANEDPMTWAKHDAREWWNSNFGQSIVVPWHLFYRRFRFRDPRFSGPAEVPLKTTLCLTSSTHVSQFNLDIFARLFGPWHKLYEVWSGLTSHPGFFRGTTFEYAEELLKRFRHLPGSFLFRISHSTPGFWAIAFVSANGQISQSLVFGVPLPDTLLQGRRSGVYTCVKGKRDNFDLRQLVNLAEDVTLPADLSVTTCPICMDVRSNVRLEPCGHFCCSQCCKNWLAESKTTHSPLTCPFCRGLILSTALVRLTLL
ncbi:hypothetical protein SprV_0200573200 [Sparganum proliferum]